MRSSLFDNLFGKINKVEKLLAVSSYNIVWQLLWTLEVVVGRIAKWCVAALVGWAVYGIPSPTSANEMKVATDDWPPFRISTDNGFEGLDIDILDELERRIGEKINVIKMPWGRGLASMQSGVVDVMIGLAYRDERAVYVDYTDTPYFRCATAFYTRKGNADLIKTYEDLKKQSVGYVLHSAYFERFDKDTELHKVGVAQEQTLIDMMKRGHLEVIIGTDCQVDYFIEQQGLSGTIEKATYNPENSDGLFLGVSKKSPWAGRLDLLSSVMEEMVQEGFVKRKSIDYYGTLTAEAEIN